MNPKTVVGGTVAFPCRLVANEGNSPVPASHRPHKFAGQGDKVLLHIVRQSLGPHPDSIGQAAAPHFERFHATAEAAMRQTSPLNIDASGSQIGHAPRTISWAPSRIDEILGVRIVGGLRRPPIADGFEGADHCHLGNLKGRARQASGVAAICRVGG